MKFAPEGYPFIFASLVSYGYSLGIFTLDYGRQAAITAFFILQSVASCILSPDFSLHGSISSETRTEDCA